MSTELTLLSRVGCRGREVTGPRLRGLLALLAGSLRAGCSVPALVDGLWPDARPENPTKAVQVLVSRIRSQFGADLIANTATGYRLTLAADEVDATAVLLHARDTRNADAHKALEAAEKGLACWDGEPDATANGDPLSQLRAARASTYLELQRMRGLALSRLCRHQEAVEALDPNGDEETLTALLRSEAATAGPARALARYDAYRRKIRDELGVDPGPELQALHQELLHDGTPPQRHGVANEPNQLLGRDDDIVKLRELLRSARVVSVVGPGGLGKTRLATVVSREAEQRLVHFVTLAGVASDDDVAGEVAAAIGDGARPARIGNEITGIVAALGAGLLVLDNCEHVVEGVAELVRALVAMGRELRILTTSRAPLGLSSESVYLLPELTLSTSAELFRQRARAARPDVELPDDVVTTICRHLDGLPLAVELAAAKVRVMSVREIADRLDNRFSLLRGGSRDSPARHRTLAAVVDWGWNLLDEEGQQALAALSVFPGGFTADAARHLVDGDLADLVGQSLLKVVDTRWGSRFLMLDTVREFAAARRADPDRAIEGFLSWATEFGLTHHDKVYAEHPTATVELIRSELDNLAQALRYALDRGDARSMVAIAVVQANLWVVENRYPRLVWLQEATGWLLSHYEPDDETLEATRTLATLGIATTYAVQGPRAVRALAVLRRLPPAPPTTLLRAVAICAVTPGEQYPALCESDEPLLAAVANLFMTYLYEVECDIENALAAAHRALVLFDQGPPSWIRISVHARYAELCLQAGRPEDALAQVHVVLALLGDQPGWPTEAGVRWGAVVACLQLGDTDQAERWFAEVAPSYGDADVLSPGLGLRAMIQLSRGDVDGGLALWRESVARLHDEELIRQNLPGFEVWTLENEAAAVIAHALHGRLAEVESVTRGQTERLAAMLVTPPVPTQLSIGGYPVLGALLLAVAATDAERTPARAARLVAIAEKWRYSKTFVGVDRIRQFAMDADRAAYERAVADYAGLDRVELRRIALELLSG
ncbi:BTAD domain-containing putative transcriptional regulator [Kutzneria sp. NPDC051319]|uniref:ATP-binding protein n=1 Tax=Kutzneria sp. NPDC051319 TaxID=3155047 RepID=UPI00342B69CC